MRWRFCLRWNGTQSFVRELSLISQRISNYYPRSIYCSNFSFHDSSFFVLFSTSDYFHFFSFSWTIHDSFYWNREKKMKKKTFEECFSCVVLLFLCDSYHTRLFNNFSLRLRCLKRNEKKNELWLWREKYCDSCITPPNSTKACPEM